MRSRNTGKKLPPNPKWDKALKDFSYYMKASGNSPATIQTRIHHLAKLSRDIDKAPEEITSDDLLKWSASHGWTPETRHSYHSSLKVFFAYFQTIHDINNPTLLLPSIRRHLPPPHPIPDSILAELLPHLHTREQIILKCAAFAGLRCKEIAELHANHLMHDSDLYYLKITGKGNKTRTIPISEELYRQLKTFCVTNDYIFPSKYHPHLTPQHISKLGNSLLPPPYTMHSLRHRYATTIYQHTHDLLIVAKLLGHSSIATTQRYTQILDDSLNEAAIWANTLHNV